MAASSRGLSEADAVQVAKEFYDSKGPSPAHSAWRRHCSALPQPRPRALRRMVPPCGGARYGDDYFVRSSSSARGPVGPGEWQVRNIPVRPALHRRRPSAPSESGPGARIDLHEYRMTVGMKVDQLRSELAVANSNGRKSLIRG